MSHVAYVNGRYLPHKLAQVHIEDRGYQFADAVYEVTCIWNGRPVDHARHLARLARSLAELSIPRAWSDAALTAIAQEVVRRNRLMRGTLYMQIGRGVAPRAHQFPARPLRPSLVMTAKHGAGAAESVAQAGVTLISVPDIRWGRVDIKTVGLLPNALAKQQAVDAKVFDALLTRPDGVVTEATASNAWIVTKDKTLVTHPLGTAILGGVTRGTVIELARAAGFMVQERPFTMAEALAAKEVFLTGTTTFVMPVVRIDDKPVANGAPGTVALDLRARYLARMDALDDTAWAVPGQPP
ncbi:MAG: D-amino-acid transaminase [Rhodospirillaceae bacterium]|nr:D-amino-acid transaminase [Rhodospirillaceae bacterium]